MDVFSLNGTWKLTGTPQAGAGSNLRLDARVPGCVQLDLSNAGYLPADLYMGENIRETEKYEGWQWWYARTFAAPEARENVWLVFEGVDCVAHYYLNGKKIGDSENMFIAHEFEVGRYLHVGENTITVHIEFPVIAAHDLDYTIDGFVTWNNAPAHTGIREAPPQLRLGHYAPGSDLRPLAGGQTGSTGSHLFLPDALLCQQQAL